MRELGIPRRRIAMSVGIPTGAPEVRARSQRPKKLIRTTANTKPTTATAIRRNMGIFFFMANRTPQEVESCLRSDIRVKR
jgi:hypothetical protein